MTIDWFTVIAQLINFFILAWLLRRFLYRPILTAIDEREKKVVSRLEEAASKMKEADEERAIFREKNREFDLHRSEKWEEALTEIKTERQEQLEKAHEEAQNLKKKLEEAFEDERKGLKRAIRDKTREEVFAIARKTLQELADETLEKSMVNAFLRRLQSPESSEEKEFTNTIAASDSKVEILSTLELTTEQRDHIERALTEKAGRKLLCEFKTDTRLVSGIELHTGGYKISWSIADYLQALEDTVTGMLNSRQESAKSSTK